MKKCLIYFFSLMFMFSLVLTANAKEAKKNVTAGNRLFSVVMPEEAKGLYDVKKIKNGILIYDKASKKAGFGGFTFGIKLFKNPSEHAVMPGGIKVGEYVNCTNDIYDVVLIRPTDVQYDYVNKKSESYDVLYNYADTAAKVMTAKGFNKYYYARGTKGEDLYKDVLEKHITAIKEKWDSTKLEQENMSYMYNVIALGVKRAGSNVADKVGYTYYDVNGDGIDELLIGEIAEGDWKGIIYDIYTMVDRKPAHVISGGNRNRYFVCDDQFICNEYSSGANESGWLIYILVDNSTELYPQVGFKYDGYENNKNPWFISYHFDQNQWESVSEEKFKERKSTFDRYERFNFIPLSSLEK